MDRIAVANAGPTPAQVRILAFLGERPGASSTDVATGTGVSEAIASLHLRSLVQQGQVRAQTTGAFYHYWSMIKGQPSSTVHLVVRDVAYDRP